LDANLLPEPAVHGPILSAARRTDVSLAFLRSLRRGVCRRRRFESRRANRVKRVRANQTCGIRAQRVKRNRIAMHDDTHDFRRDDSASRVVLSSVVVGKVEEAVRRGVATRPPKRRASIRQRGVRAISRGCRSALPAAARSA
jgi:hypothetical protein